MGNHLIQTEDKLFLFMKYASVGMAEIDMSGAIISINIQGEAVLAPIVSAHKSNSNNLFDILSAASPELTNKIRQYIDVAGNIIADEPPVFLFSTGTGKKEQHYNVLVSKISPESIIISFENIENGYRSEKKLQQAILDTGVVQGKFEIASNVLHDIGNAIVGFTSYLTRIKHSLEQDNTENLENLVGFFEANQSALAGVIGEAKAGALVKIISGLAQTQKINRTDISQSITEQQHIITHIQEILNIHRQYVNGNGIDEKRSTHLNSIIKDSMAMVLASLNKRNITVALDIPENLPVIKGDRTKLMQVILNILKNSIEAIDIYAANKSISLSIINKTDFLELNIKDSGKGFDEAIKKNLFSRGFTTKSSGTGLGLEHCRAILESYGNTIDITSEGPDMGALTTIHFKTQTD
jgi:signal transduction histidine kinase